MKKRRKPQYFRFSVDKLDGKLTEHTTHLAAKESDVLAGREDNEFIVRADHDFVDEAVIDDWFHLEAMARREYWINIAGVTILVYLRKDGSVKQIHVYEPGEYDEPREGVEYGFKVTPPKATAKAEAKKARKLLRERGRKDG